MFHRRPRTRTRPGAHAGAARAAAVVLAIAIGTSLPLGAQQAASYAAAPSPPDSATAAAQALRTDDPPVIDGVPDEAAWSAATPLDRFIQRVPRDGQLATEDTDVRVLFDGEAIYVGVWAWESHAGQIVTGEAIRDFEVTDSDAIVMILDTFNDEQNGFVFGTTPAGIEYDGQVAAGGSGGGFFLGGGTGTRRSQAGAGGGFNKNWDGSWTVATSQDERGWYAEFRIPFTTLRYTPGESEWGFNVTRRVRHLNEEAFWSEVPREFDLYRLDFAGVLQIAPPTRLSGTATPYLLGAAARDFAAGESSYDRQGEVGGEAKLQITQGLTADLTVNTDFAQVEVDDAQVNLTRFPLLFPEKRPFFLENAGFFTVGGGGADLFFSRRIGIDDGTPIPIKGGGRVSGRTLGLNVGGLYIQTEGAPDIAAQGRNAYGVARVAKELPNRSKVGVLFTDRRSDITGDDSQTYAVDGQLGIGDALTFTSYFARTATPGRTGDDVAWDVTGGVTTRAFRANATIQQIGEDFDPEIGFVPRRGHRYYQLFGMYYIRPNRIFRELRPHVSYFTYRNIFEDRANRGFEISSRLHVDNHWEWDSGMELHTGANWVREGLFEPFEIRGVTDEEGDPIIVPTGLYDGWESQIVFFTDQSRTLSFNSRFNWGAFLSGSKRTTSADVTFRHGDRSSATVSAQYNDVELPEGDFTTLLTSLRLGYFFTPRLYVQGLIQYSDQIDRWSTNLRLGWLDTAGTGLFIVYNDVQGFDTLRGPQARSLIVKYTRQFDLFGM